MTVPDLVRKYPIPFCLFAIVVFSVLTEIPLQGLFAPHVGPLYADYLTGIIEQSLATAGVILVGWLVGLRTMGLNSPRPWRAVLLGWPLLLFSVLNCPEIVVDGNLVADLVSLKAAALFVLYLSTGFIEETLFRGLISGALRRSWAKDRATLTLAVLVSSLFFGLTHFMNLFQRRYTPLASLTQVMFGVFFGVFFEALYLRTRSLYPGILLHALVDFTGNLAQLMPGARPRAERIVSKTPQEALISVAVALPLLLIGLFLLRKVDAGKGGSASPGASSSSWTWRTSERPEPPG